MMDMADTNIYDAQIEILVQNLWFRSMQGKESVQLQNVKCTVANEDSKRNGVSVE